MAATFLDADIDTVQVESVPVQSPLQPVKVESESAFAVRVTDVAEDGVYAAVQLLPQPSLPSALVTDPLPVPDFEIVKSAKSANLPTCPERTGHT